MAAIRIMPLHIAKAASNVRRSATLLTMQPTHKRPITAGSSRILFLAYNMNRRISVFLLIRPDCSIRQNRLLLSVSLYYALSCPQPAACEKMGVCNPATNHLLLIRIPSYSIKKHILI